MDAGCTLNSGHRLDYGLSMMSQEQLKIEAKLLLNASQKLYVASIGTTTAVSISRPNSAVPELLVYFHREQLVISQSLLHRML